MKLYYASGTCALACWIALEWAKADYQVEKVNPRSDEYKAINPLAQVPAVDIGTGRVMGQADAILQYIAQTHSEADLGANDGVVNHFEFNEIMCFLTGDFHPAFWPYFVPQRFTTDDSEEALAKAKEASYARIERVMTHLDALLGDSNHLYQNKRTVADAYAFVMLRWSSRLEKSWKTYPNIQRFMTAMFEDEAVKYVLEHE